MMKRNNRTGFTLVEMLTVIAIIGILASLILPTIGSMQEKARATQCRNNMKRLAEAVAGYTSAKEYFPASRKDYPKAVGPEPLLPMTWIMNIFPYMDAQVAYNQWKDMQVTHLLDPATMPPIATPPSAPFPAPPVHYAYNAQVATVLPSLRCPSDTTLDARPFELSVLSANGGQSNELPDTSYVGNGGFLPRPGFDPAPYGNQPYMITAMNRNNGIFHDVEAGGKRAQLLPSQVKDGLTNTILISENLQANYYFFNGIPTHPSNPLGATGVTPFNIHQNRYSTLFFFFYVNSGTVVDNNVAGNPAGPLLEWMRINREKDATPRLSDPVDPVSGIIYARPSSNHGDSVNMAFVDASVQVIQEDIDYHVYQALMTPRGEKSDVPWRRYVLSEADWSR